MNKNAKIITLGCRLNQTDEALIYSKLQKAGFHIADDKSANNLDLIIINTCSVTSSAARKSRQYARSFKEKNPGAVLAVTGCDSQIDKNIWKEIGVDILIPNTDKSEILNYLKEFFEIPEDVLPDSAGNDLDLFKENDVGLFPFKTRANLKIQDGCDSFCTYCIVPYGRGRPRSRDLDDTIYEFKALVDAGFKEIVITGVNIATYNHKGKNLIDLLKELLKITGTYRIRLGSTEPQFSMSGLLELLSSDRRLCRFLHLPLQHGSNRILKRMGRNYTREDFADFVMNAVSMLPGICIGSDIIAGFPGETDDDFDESRTFLTNLPLSYLHVFSYSKREGTPAASYANQINPRIIAQRNRILTTLAENLSESFLNSQRDKSAVMLPENENKGIITGWTDNYIKVKLDTGDRDAGELMNQGFLKVVLKETLKYREMKAVLQ